MALVAVEAGSAFVKTFLAVTVAVLIVALEAALAAEARELVGAGTISAAGAEFVEVEAGLSTGEEEGVVGVKVEGEERRRGLGDFLVVLEILGGGGEGDDFVIG